MRIRENFEAAGKKGSPGPMRLRDLYRLLLAARVAFVYPDAVRARTLVRAHKDCRPLWRLDAGG